MKKYLLFILSVALIGIIVLQGCSQNTLQDNTNTSVVENKPRLTFVSPMIGNPYWNMVDNGVKSAAKELGVDLKTTGPIVANVDEQIKEIQAAIYAKVEGIITMALDSKEFEPIINQAVEAGIPVILIDTDSPDSKRTAYIGTANMDAGMKAGELLINEINGVGKIAIITGPSGQKNISDRIEGFTNTVQKNPGIDIIAVENGNSNLLQITEKTNLILSKHPDITAIFCAEGYGAIGVGRVIKENKLIGKITVIGFDDVDETLRYVREGIVQITIVQNTYQMGYISVQVLNDIINGKKIENTMIYTDVTIVTKENVDTYKNTQKVNIYN